LTGWRSSPTSAPIYDNYDFRTEILVASIRHPVHVLQSAKIGADVITAPPAVIRALVKHPLTDRGLEGFAADWAKTGRRSAETGPKGEGKQAFFTSA
jgi:transaldolase